MKNLKIFSLGIAMLISSLSFGQERTITGTVTDPNGPLPGTNVVVKYTQRGVATDIYGNYSIKVSKGEILLFTFLGMCDETRPVTDANSIDIIMQEEPVSLETVIRPGCSGIKKRKNQTLSCGKTITAEEIELKPKSEKVTLKGTNRCFSNYKERLVVVDNKITSLAELQQIPPEKIKTVTILKGAEGTALYGSDGVNGVIIVTTKEALPEKGNSKKNKKKSDVELK